MARAAASTASANSSRPWRASSQRTALLKALEVGQHQLGLNRLGIRNRVDAAFDMGDVAAFEAAQHVDDCIHLSDVRQELVAEAFALRRAADQSGDVDELNLRFDFLRGLRDCGNAVQPLVGHGDAPNIGLDRAERIIGRLRCRRLREGVEQGGFADVRQADDAAAEAHAESCSLLVMNAALTPRSAATREKPGRFPPGRTGVRWAIKAAAGAMMVAAVPVSANVAPLTPEGRIIMQKREAFENHARTSFGDNGLA